MDAISTFWLSLACFAIGLISWALPSWKYHLQRPVGYFAIVLIFCGLILMTTFKWSEVALEIQGARLQLTQVREQLAAAEERIASAEKELDLSQDRIAELSSALESAHAQNSQGPQRLQDQDTASGHPQGDLQTEEDVAAADGEEDIETGATDSSPLRWVQKSQLWADDFIGATIYGANDQRIGSVGDIILTQDGNIDALIVDAGGFLGIGAKEVALGFEDLEFFRDPDGNLYLFTEYTQEQIEAAPEFDEASFAEHRNEQLLDMQ